MFKSSFFALLVSCQVFAQQPQVVALTFTLWKEQQVLEAQNQMLRTSSRISLARTNKLGGTEAKDNTGLPPNRVRKASDSESVAAEKELKRAQESLEIASALQFADYINIYIPTLADQPEAITKLSEKLTKEELAEIFRSQTKRLARPSDAKRSSGAMGDGLASTSRGRSF